MPSPAQPAVTAPDLMRGVAGGVLLGVPLLYTQEVWAHGASVEPLIVLLLLGVAFGLAVALNYYVGFEKGRGRRPLRDAIIGSGLSLILAALLLLLLDRIQIGMPHAIVTGTIALTAVPIMIGFAIGNALAPREGGKGSERMAGGAGDLLAAAGGAILLALNIAPTEEPILLAGELGWARLGLIVGVSLLLPYLIVFYAEFEGADARRASDGATQGPLVETLLAYLVAFSLSALLLASFGRTEALDSIALSETVVLAFPAALGAALGRMLV